MKTEAELVGGCADGVRLEPEDPTEPDDWPDILSMSSNETGATDRYGIRGWTPAIVGGVRVYYFDVI